ERMTHALRVEEATAQAASANVDDTMGDDASTEEEIADSEAEEEGSDSSENALVVDVLSDDWIIRIQ
ncbi:hypothetical protein L195_g058727, partial [Trifolium pratense]